MKFRGVDEHGGTITREEYYRRQAEQEAKAVVDLHGKATTRMFRAEKLT